jgi:hypothetical protein
MGRMRNSHEILAEDSKLDHIILKFKFGGGGDVQDVYSPGYEPVTGSCEHGDERYGSKAGGEYLE